MGKESRALEKHEYKLGYCDVATASYSFGDVICVDTVDSLVNNLFLADISGHKKNDGDAFSDFINRAIEQGWGRGNIKKEILELSAMLPQEEEKLYGDIRSSLINIIDTPYEEFKKSIMGIREIIPALENEPWFRDVCCQYLQFKGPEILIAGSTGLPFPLKIKEEKVYSQRFKCFGWHLNDATDSLSFSHLELAENEVLMLRTDGVDDNLEAHFGTGSEEQGKIGMKYLNYIVRVNINESAARIRDLVISELGPYIKPHNEREDDATLVFMKRT